MPQWLIDLDWPNPPDPTMIEYECPSPLGCDHTRWAEYIPECPRHRIRMVPVEDRQ
jgi:hypothetical protein